MSPKDALPEYIRSLLWDCDPDAVSITEHKSFLIRRILDRGSWDAMKWLRSTMGDDAIREWLAKTEGGGLGARKLRFWELILDLPEDMVTQWIARTRESTWERRQSA